MDAQRGTIDLKRLAAEVSVQHGIRVDPDDPMMAVVTLNRLVFEQAIAQVLERVQASVKDFEAAADKVQIRAGAVLAQEVRDCGVAFRQQFDQALESSRRSGSATPTSKCGEILLKWPGALGAITLALVFFALGIWIGRTVR